MPISRNHHDLFHSSDTSDKLNLFQTLLDSRTLRPDEALALLNTIHAELEQHAGHDPSVYARYVRMMESLRQQMPAVHQEVTTKWEQLHSRIQGQVPETYATDAEESQGRIKRSEVKIQAPLASEEIQKPLIKETGRIHIEDQAEIESGEQLEGPEPQEEAEEIEGKEEEQEKEEEVEKYGEEVEEEELEEKEADEEETEEKEDENEEEEKETEAEEEKEEVEEKEEGEEEEVEEAKEEIEEKKEKEEVEEKEEEQEESEKEVEAVVTEESSTEADRMATEAAEAAHEMEHPEMEVEEQPEAEEVEINPPGEEPPMETAE